MKTVSIFSSFPLGFKLIDISFAIWGLMSLGKTANKPNKNKNKQKSAFPFSFPVLLMFHFLHTNFISFSSFSASNSHAFSWDFAFFVLFLSKLNCPCPQTILVYLNRLLYFSPKGINYCWEFQEPWKASGKKNPLYMPKSMHVYELGRGKAGKWGAMDVRILLSYIVYAAILFTYIGPFWSRKDMAWYIWNDPLMFPQNTFAKIGLLQPCHHIDFLLLLLTYKIHYLI